MQNPPIVDFEITRKCNFKCIFCTSPPFADGTKELSTAEIKNALVKFCRAGVKETIITGGEPLYRKDAAEILSFARSLSMKVYLTTNGSLITKKMAKILKDLDIKTQIQLSALARCERLTGVKNSSKKTMRGIKNLIARGTIPSVSCVVTRLNLNEIEKVVRTLRNLGVTNFHIINVIPSGRAAYNYSSLAPSLDEIQKIYLKLKKVGGIYLKFSNFFSPSRTMRAFRFLEQQHVCEGGRYKVSVLPNGEVMICKNLPKISKFILGNIKEKQFDIICKSQKLKRFRREVETIPATCRECELKRFCCGGCPAIKLFYGRSISDVDPRCPHAKHGELARGDHRET